MLYIHQRQDWPNLTWNHAELLTRLGMVRHLQGKLMGKMSSLGFVLQKEAELETLTLDVLKSTEIEGEFLSAPLLPGALKATDHALARVLAKAKFWERYQAEVLNERQRSMINKLFDGFEGKLTSSKWAKIAKCSADTALRDIQYLVHKGMLKKDVAGGRSTSYELNLDEPGVTIGLKD